MRAFQLFHLFPCLHCWRGLMCVSICNMTNFLRPLRRGKIPIWIERSRMRVRVRIRVLPPGTYNRPVSSLSSESVSVHNGRLRSPVRPLVCPRRRRSMAVKIDKIVHRCRCRWPGHGDGCAPRAKNSGHCTGLGVNLPAPSTPLVYQVPSAAPSFG